MHRLCDILIGMLPTNPHPPPSNQQYFYCNVPVHKYVHVWCIVVTEAVADDAVADDAVADDAVADDAVADDAVADGTVPDDAVAVVLLL